MKDAPPHLKALKEIERDGLPGLVEVLRESGIDAVRYVLWDATGWHRDYSPPAWRNRASAERKREGWEMALRIEKIIATALHEAHKEQVEEAMDALSEGSESFYESRLGDGPESRFRALLADGAREARFERVATR